MVYSDDLYRAGSKAPLAGPRAPLPAMAEAGEADSAAVKPQVQRPDQRSDERRSQTRTDDPVVNHATGVKSDIQRLYEKYLGK